MYSSGASEIILGKALKAHQIPREDVVIMTKVFAVVSRDMTIVRDNADEVGYVNQHGLSRKHIFDSVKASLKRLDLEYIDVLQCHRFDYDTPIEETMSRMSFFLDILQIYPIFGLKMQALHDIVKAGYVRYIGMSSCWAWQFHAMQNTFSMLLNCSHLMTKITRLCDFS